MYPKIERPCPPTKLPSIMPSNTISRVFVGLPREKSVAEKLATRLYDLARRPDGRTAYLRTAVRRDATPIRIVCISDTHNTKPSDLPEGDILVHAGDLSQFGTFTEIQAQLSWLASQPHPHKIVIAGNHDLLLDATFVAAHPDRELDRPGKARGDLEWADVRYLEHKAIDLTVGDRSVRIFGSPWTPRCGSWAFQYDDANAPWENLVPEETDVVVVHGPPKGHLDDGGKGCGILLKELWRARPRVVVCGHIHAGRGEQWLHFDGVDRWYENVLLGGTLEWMSLACLAFSLFWVVVSRVLRSGEVRAVDGRLTQLVNAAVVGDRNGREKMAVVAVM